MSDCPECTRLVNEYLGPERVAIRDAYQAAYKAANKTVVTPNLSYDRGWWQLWSINGFRDIRVRQAKLVEMTDVLKRRAEKEKSE